LKKKLRVSFEVINNLEPRKCRRPDKLPLGNIATSDD
jgi:hypothetical protein